jgi:solute carrier family 50 (sugar transporter)
MSIYYNIQAISLQYHEQSSNQLRQSIIAALVPEDKLRMSSYAIDSTDDGKSFDAADGINISTSQEVPEAAPGTYETMTAETASINESPVQVVMDYAKLVWQVTSLERPAPMLHERMVLFLTVLWIAAISILGFGSPSDDNDDDALLSSASVRENFIGYLTVSNLIFFYGAPLSTIRTVISTRSTETIHIRTMITNTATGLFWCIYGLTIQDWFVGVPNGIGAFLGFIQVFFVIIFPREKKQSSNVEVNVDAPDKASTALEPTP